MMEADALDALRLIANGDKDAGARLARRDGEAFVDFLRQNVILLRTHDALISVGHAPGALLAAAAKSERARVARAWDDIGRVAAVCQAEGVAHAFPKATQHEPDMGHDIDLLVMTRGRAVDGAIARALGLTEEKPSLFNRIAGKTGLAAPGGAAPIEIHHARLGQVGEQEGLARSIVERATPRAEAPHVPVPSPEDRLLLQAAQRVMGHRSLRVGDVLAGWALLALPLDAKRLARETSELGVDVALRVYLGAVGDLAVRAGVHMHAPPVKTSRLPLRFRGKSFHFSAPRVAMAYATKFTKDATSGRAASAARIVLIPPAGILSVALRQWKRAFVRED